MNDVPAEGTWRVRLRPRLRPPGRVPTAELRGLARGGGGGCPSAPMSWLLLSLLLSDPTAEDLPLALLRLRLCRGGASGFGGGRAPLACWAATSLRLWHQLRIQKHDDDRHVVPAA